MPIETMQKSIPELMQELHEKETAELRKPDREMVDRLVDHVLDIHPFGDPNVTIRGFLPAGANHPGAAETIVRKIIEATIEEIEKR